MFDWVPIELYRSIYTYTLLFLVLLTLLYANKYSLEERQNKLYVSIIGIILFLFTFFYIGFRPIHGIFIDMRTYEYIFNSMLKNPEYKIESDKLFWYFTLLCTKIFTIKQYFSILAFLYVSPILLLSYSLFKKGYFYSIFLFFASFSFWAYGTNGLRNGVATSLFLLLFATNIKWLQCIILLAVNNIHSSMLVPTIAFIISNLYNKPKYVLAGWLGCIPISLILGGPIQGLFAGLMEDDRTIYLTKEVSDSKFSSTGFRWDFLMYSASAVYAGWYYIFKKNFNDKKYNIIYCTYLIANGFWILVIKANYSNRFAYLSWFMMALVIIYPLLKKYIVNKQYKILVYIMLAYFGFTFFMSEILK